MHTCIHQQLSQRKVWIVQHILLAQHTYRHRSRSNNSVSYKTFQLWQHLAQATFYLSFIDNLTTTILPGKMNILHITSMQVKLRVLTKKNHCSISRTFICKIIQMNSSQLFFNITIIGSQHFVIYNLRKILPRDKVCVNIINCCAKTRSGIKCSHI